MECVGEFLGIDTDKGLYEHSIRGARSPSARRGGLWRLANRPRQVGVVEHALATDICSGS
jgi:hypothetical protein